MVREKTNKKTLTSTSLFPFREEQNKIDRPPLGSIVSKEALAAAAASSSLTSGPPFGRVPRRPALRISAAEPHGGGGGGGRGGDRAPSLARRPQQQPPSGITQLTRLTLATGDPGDAAAVLGNRIGKAGGGGAGVASVSRRSNNVHRSAADRSAADDDDAGAAPSASSLPPPSHSAPFSARRSYVVLAIRPLNSRVLTQAATSLDVDVIVLDFTGNGSGGSRGANRPPPPPQARSSPSSFSLARMPKPAALRPALSRGISLEVRYAPALSSEPERRALLAGLSSLATTLRGKGGGGGSGKTRRPGAECLSPFLLSSGATSSSSLRAPLDVAALAQVGGLSGGAALAAVSRVPAQVATRARRRRAASRGECGFLKGREGMEEVAAMEVEKEQKKRKRKAGSGGGMQFNQQARQQKQQQQQGRGGGGGGKKKKKGKR